MKAALAEEIPHWTLHQLMHSAPGIDTVDSARLEQTFCLEQEKMKLLLCTSLSRLTHQRCGFFSWNASHGALQYQIWMTTYLESDPVASSKKTGNAA
jgi:hypothetical protein